jgi:hypothetical protein
MAKYTSIVRLSGRVGDAVFYDYRDLQVMRMAGNLTKDRIARDPAFARSRESSREFGGSSVAGALIRQGMGPVLKRCPDGRLAASLTKLCHQVQGGLGRDVAGSEYRVVGQGESASAISIVSGGKAGQADTGGWCVVDDEVAEERPLVRGYRPVPLSCMAGVLHGLCSPGSRLVSEGDRVMHPGPVPGKATHVRALVQFFTLSDVVYDAERGKYMPVLPQQKKTIRGPLTELREGSEMCVVPHLSRVMREGMANPSTPLRNRGEFHPDFYREANGGLGTERKEIVMCAVLVEFVELKGGFEFVVSREWIVVEPKGVVKNEEREQGEDGKLKEEAGLPRASYVARAVTQGGAHAEMALQGKTAEKDNGSRWLAWSAVRLSSHTNPPCPPSFY